VSAPNEPTVEEEALRRVAKENCRVHFCQKCLSVNVSIAMYGVDPNAHEITGDWQEKSFCCEDCGDGPTRHWFVCDQHETACECTDGGFTADDGSKVQCPFHGNDPIVVHADPRRKATDEELARAVAFVDATEGICLGDEPVMAMEFEADDGDPPEHGHEVWVQAWIRLPESDS